MKHGAAIIMIITCVFISAREIFTAEKTTPHHEITGDFKTPQDVTRQCLECHPEAGDQILQSRHWKWQDKKTIKRGDRFISAGKINILNNFCIALTSNWPRCTSCHAGYGWKDKKFDFADRNNIDCLICHDTTGLYEKLPTGSGYPAREKTVIENKTYNPPDYLAIARKAGKSSRKNCGTCHFFGGGGDAVKHGNIDSTLLNPDRDSDVHMGRKNYNCSKCHYRSNHVFVGKMHGSRATGGNTMGCDSCHSGNVHKNAAINRHMDHVACQTCHIPLYATAKPTKTWWDWSVAGQDRADIKKEHGMPTYDKKKGEFKWVKDAVPVYLWSDGSQDITIEGDKIKNPGEEFILNRQNGAIKDDNSRIMPFKVMKGKQAYDVKNGYILIPKLFGPGGYWATYDWNKSFIEGMKAADLPYSGSYDWIVTVMYWPVNHMVPPKEKALQCNDCHGKNGRLDWKALGYKNDPGKSGGRFKKQR